MREDGMIDIDRRYGLERVSCSPPAENEIDVSLKSEIKAQTGKQAR